jgi:hypothetical protein
MVLNSAAVDLSFLNTGKKANWLHDAFEALNSGRYPRILGISYWNENWGDFIIKTELRIDSSPEALNAYRNGIAKGSYTATPNWNISSTNEYRLIAPPNGTYHGANPDTAGWEDDITTQAIVGFEELAQFPIMWVYFSNNWWDGVIEFPAEDVQIIHQAGKIPFIRLMARSSQEEEIPDPIFTLQSIIDGNYDTALKKWAEDAQKVDIPLLIDFGIEVNGEWFPWNAKWNGAGDTTEYGDPSKYDGAERFVAAYRHIHTTLSLAGAKNLTWLFHLDCESHPDEPWNAYELYYPGDNYVDWIGISCYGPQYPTSSWEGMGFTERMDIGYDRIAAISAQKPLVLIEFGVGETADTVKPFAIIVVGLGIGIIIGIFILVRKLKKR